MDSSASFDVPGLGLRGLGDRQPRGPHRRGATRPLLDRPVDRAGPPDRVLQPVAVLQVQPPHLRIVLGPILFQHIAHRQEHLRPAGVHVQLGLEHPHPDRDRRGCLAVVAQRDLDKHPPTGRVVVAVHPQADGVAQRDRRRLAGFQIGQPYGAGFLDRDALEVADRATGLGDLVGLHRLVGAPRGGDRERLQVEGNLEPQTHRRRNHQALLGCSVLGVVLVRVGLVLVGRERRDTADLGHRFAVGARLDQIARARSTPSGSAPSGAIPVSAPARCARPDTASAG